MGWWFEVASQGGLVLTNGAKSYWFSDDDRKTFSSQDRAKCSQLIKTNAGFIPSNDELDELRAQLGATFQQHDAADPSCLLKIEIVRQLLRVPAGQRTDQLFALTHGNARFGAPASTSDVQEAAESLARAGTIQQKEGDSIDCFFLTDEQRARIWIDP